MILVIAGVVHLSGAEQRHHAAVNGKLRIRGNPCQGLLGENSQERWWSIAARSRVFFLWDKRPALGELGLSKLCVPYQGIAFMLPLVARVSYQGVALAMPLVAD